MLAINSTPDGSITDWKVIPSCNIWAIRNYFPSENQEYTPFSESNDDEDGTCQ